MTSVLSLMVLILSDGTEERALMKSAHCRADFLALKTIADSGVTIFNTRRNVVVGFECRPWKMEAQS